MAFVYWIHAEHHKDMFTEGYIGYTSKTVEGRFKEHLKAANNTSSTKHIIHRALLKYKDTVKISTIIEGSEEYCLEMEEKLRPTEKIGWNQNKGGFKPPSWKGKKQNPESVKKRWDGLKAKRALETIEEKTARLASYSGWTEESKAKHSEGRKGIKFSESHIENMRKCQLGKKRSEDTKAKAHARLLATRASKTYAVVHPWNTSSANKEVWAIADKAFEFISANPAAQSNQTDVYLGLAKQKISTIFKKIKGGWNPLTDLEWLAFKEQYNKEHHAA